MKYIIKIVYYENGEMKECIIEDKQDMFASHLIERVKMFEIGEAFGNKDHSPYQITISDESGIRAMFNDYEGKISRSLIEGKHTIENAVEPAKKEMVNHPDHYNHGMECIEEMKLVFGLERTADWCLMTAWKYRKRAPFKDDAFQDMEKSDWYIQEYKNIKEQIERPGIKDFV